MLKLRPIHVLVFVVALVLLGALAWGVGWAAHGLVGEGRTAATDPTPEATFTLAVATATGIPATSVPTPTDVSPVSPTSTPALTSTPVPTIVPSPTPDFILHIVRRGDTLFSLAHRYGTTVEAIRIANELHSDYIQAGQTLKIPLTSTEP